MGTRIASIKDFSASEYGRKILLMLFSGSVFLLIFLKLAEDLLANELATFDKVAIQIVRGFENPFLTIVMKSFTFMGSPQAVITITLVVMYFVLRRKKHYLEGFFFLMALLGGWGLEALFKSIFHRVRPGINRLIDITGYSFPSGHATVGFAFYGMLAYLLYINLKNRRARILIPFLILVMVFFIGISRIYLGVHYPSDVIAGFATGGLVLSGSILGLHATEHYRDRGKV